MPTLETSDQRTADVRTFMKLSKFDHPSLIPLAVVMLSASVLVQASAPAATALLASAAFALLAARLLTAMFDCRTAAYARRVFDMTPSQFLPLASLIVVSLSVAEFGAVITIGDGNPVAGGIAGAAAVVFLAVFRTLLNAAKAKRQLRAARRATRTTAAA